MEAFEIKECLNSLSILVDTREHPTVDAERRWMSFEVPYERQHLDYGDYTYNFCYPSGKYFYETGEDKVVYPDVMVERKMNLEELSACLFQQKDRFDREFERAAARGASIYLLVENATWEKINAGKYKTKVHPNAFMGRLMSLQARYHIQIIFCKPELTGLLIRNILQKELKLRLERGDYDCQIKDG